MIKIICTAKQKDAIIEALADSHRCIDVVKTPFKRVIKCAECIENNIDWIIIDNLASCENCKHYKKKITAEPCLICFHMNKFERKN